MRDVHESLLGSRISASGELTIQGFEAPDYEELCDMLNETVVLPALHGRDYYDFLGRWAVRYHHRRQSKRYYEISYDPLIQNQPHDLNTRQQLAIIKFYISRRVHSAY